MMMIHFVLHVHLIIETNEWCYYNMYERGFRINISIIMLNNNNNNNTQANANIIYGRDVSLFCILWIRVSNGFEVPMNWLLGMSVVINITCIRFKGWGVWYVMRRSSSMNTCHVIEERDCECVMCVMSVSYVCFEVWDLGEEKN